MRVHTFSFNREQGWSTNGFPPFDSANSLVLAFGASEFLADTAVFEQLKTAYPTSLIAGCSTAGEIQGDKLSDGTISVAVAQFESCRLAVASAKIETSAKSFEAGAFLAQSLLDDNLKAVFVLSDGLNVNGSELVRGLNNVLSENVVVTGGLAGDGSRFAQTWVLKDGLPASGYITAIGIYGEAVVVGHGSKGGWDKFGPERMVTRSTGSVLYELDGKPALELYKEYLGERASGLPATGLLFPLALRFPDDQKMLVRTILAVDEEEQSMTFAGDIPEGAIAQLMYANFDRLVGGALDAATAAAKPCNTESDVLAVAISCVGRRLILKDKTEEEIEAAIDALPTGSQLLGFYSYGEISPYASGKCDLHNQTMTLTTFAEAA